MEDSVIVNKPSRPGIRTKPGKALHRRCQPWPRNNAVHWARSLGR
jgi:hypothetical protein